MKYFSLFLQCIFIIPIWVTGQKLYNNLAPQLSQLKIGGIFDSSDTDGVVILKQAVEHINLDSTILPNHNLIVVSESLNSSNSYDAESKICNLLKQGVVGIFGPRATEAASHTQAVCDRFDIPDVETRWDYFTRQNKYTINLFPHPEILGEAYTNLVNDLKEWKRLVIVYGSEENLLNLQGLLKATKPSKRIIYMRRLSQHGDYRPLLKSLQRDYDIKRIIVACDIQKALQVLKQAQEIGMIRFDYEYILTTLDLQPWDLDEFKNGDARVWSFRMINPESAEAVTVLGERTLFHNSDQIGSTLEGFKRRGISISEALVYDAVKLFAKALHENVDGLRSNQLVTCDNDMSWSSGSSIVNSMRSMSAFQGLTGIVEFNNTGYRTDIVLELIGLSGQGSYAVGRWEYARHYYSRFTLYNPEVNKEPETVQMSLVNRTLIVATTMNKPFMMFTPSQEVLTGNDRFKGYSADLLELLHKKLGFNYNIRVVEEGTNDEMVRRVMYYRADIAIGDLTITKERQKELDFTMPFMNVGIAILFTEPQPKPPSLFSFMSPFAPEVWIFIVISFFAVSFVLFVVGRFTSRKSSKNPCIQDPGTLQSQFSLGNSFWFTLASIMEQGTDLAPKSVSTRMIALTWWFFTIIMVNCYTANLATYLIVQELEYTFSTLDELAYQTKIDYGCVVHGSTMKFFKFSNDYTKQKIWENMERKQEILLKRTIEEGVQAVKANPGKYAFFMESTKIEFYTERICGLTQVGGLLDHKGYGIALQKGSPYLDLFNEQILHLQESGELDRLKRKWWKEEGKENAETCLEPSASDAVKALDLTNLGGVFVVLVCGCIVAVTLTFIEVVIRSWQTKSEGESLFHEILKHLLYALQCRRNVEPVKKSSVASIGISPEPLGDLTILT